MFKKNNKGAQTTKVVALFSSRKGAMEMSVGTIVTIVLLMAVLVLGLVLVQKIFGSATTAIDNVDSQIQNEISKVFDDEGGNLVIYPSSRTITIDKDDKTPSGFAFAVKNNYNAEKKFSYLVFAVDVKDCGSSFTEEDANDLLLGGSGTFSLSSGEDTVSNADIVKFLMNENVPVCTMQYRINVCKGISECMEEFDEEEEEQYSYETATIFVTIK